jgi:hypothetical protein
MDSFVKYLSSIDWFAVANGFRVAQLNQRLINIVDIYPSLSGFPPDVKGVGDTNESNELHDSYPQSEEVLRRKCQEAEFEQ